MHGYMDVKTNSVCLCALVVISCTLPYNVCIVDRIYEQLLPLVLEVYKNQKSAQKTTIIAKRELHRISLWELHRISL